MRYPKPYLYWLAGLLSLALMAGCDDDPDLGSRPFEPSAAAAAETVPVSFRGLAASNISIHSARKGVEPGPGPKPGPGGKCENCDGTGQVGDGTIMKPCPVCGGDGKLDNAIETARNELVLSGEWKEIEQAREAAAKPAIPKAEQQTAQQSPAGDDGLGERVIDPDATLGRQDQERPATNAPPVDRVEPAGDQWRSTRQALQPAQREPDREIRHHTDETGVRAIVFTDGKCEPCVRLAQTLEQLRGDGWTYGSQPINHFQIANAENASELFVEYGVQQVPTIVLLVNGHEQARRVGYQSRAALANWVNGWRTWHRRNYPRNAPVTIGSAGDQLAFTAPDPADRGTMGNAQPDGIPGNDRLPGCLCSDCNCDPCLCRNVRSTVSPGYNSTPSLTTLACQPTGVVYSNAPGYGIQQPAANYVTRTVYSCNGNACGWQTYATPAVPGNYVQPYNGGYTYSTKTYGSSYRGGLFGRRRARLAGSGCGG